jgi:hypothetical protein
MDGPPRMEDVLPGDQTPPHHATSSEKSQGPEEVSAVQP